MKFSYAYVQYVLFIHQISYIESISNVKDFIPIVRCMYFLVDKQLHILLTENWILCNSFMKDLVCIKTLLTLTCIYFSAKTADRRKVHFHHITMYFTSYECYKTKSRQHLELTGYSQEMRYKKSENPKHIYFIQPTVNF